MAQSGANSVGVSDYWVKIFEARVRILCHRPSGANEDFDVEMLLFTCSVVLDSLQPHEL